MMRVRRQCQKKNKSGRLLSICKKMPWRVQIISISFHVRIVTSGYHVIYVRTRLGTILEVLKFRWKGFSEWFQIRIRNLKNIWSGSGSHSPDLKSFGNGTWFCTYSWAPFNSKSSCVYISYFVNSKYSEQYKQTSNVVFSC